MDQLFALGSISTGTKILELAPDEISTAPARNRRHSHSSLYASSDSIWSNPGPAYGFDMRRADPGPGSHRRCKTFG